MSEPATTASDRASLTARAAMASIAMAVILIALKSWAAVQTSSMAMLGSLADSGLDLVASLVVLLGVRVAAQPADYDHRFGHGKAEALASLVQVILITLSALCVTLFLGGWHGPGFDGASWTGPLWFIGKLVLLLFIFIWMRTTLPRLRYDQLMRFGWKVLLPVATINAVITAILVVAL